MSSVKSEAPDTARELSAEEIVATYGNMVLRIARHYMGNRTDADDVFQETFVSYFRHERTFESEEHRKAWLIRVTVNCAKTMLKNRRYDTELDEGLTRDENHEHENSPEEKLTVRDAVERLPLIYREVITLYYLEDRSISEITELLGITETNVKQRLMRARTMLRSALGED